MEYTDPHPVNALAGRFSIPYAVAAAIQTRGLRAASFGNEVMRKTDVSELCDRVQVHHDPALDGGYPAGRPARVRITLRDGATLDGEAKYPRGDVTNPIGADQRRAKALGLMNSVYGRAGAEAVLDAIDAVCAGSKTATLTAALRDLRRT
jgi:2-methylcitrate dehydratase PrpD